MLIFCFLLDLPKLNITRIPHWPAGQPINDLAVLDDINEDFFDDSYINIENDSSVENVENVDPTAEQCLFVITEVVQLKGLFRYCHTCGEEVDDSTLKMSSKGGVAFFKYWCKKCRCKRFWRSSSSNLFALKLTTTAMLSGIMMAQIVKFFAILQCAFPAKRTLFLAAQNFV